MRIEGDLATYELSDLLQWLAQGHKTGTLVIRNDRGQYRLGFDQGRIVMSASSDPAEHLDRYLQARGLIDAETMERAERLRAATQMRSGQVLVTLGAITEEQLAAALRQKTEEMICELLTWKTGSFEFQGGEQSDQGRVPISLEVTKLLLQSMQRLDDEARPAKTSAPAPAEPPAEPTLPEPRAEATAEPPAEDEPPEAAPTLPAGPPVPVPEIESAATAVLPMPDAASEPQISDGLALAEILDPASVIEGAEVAPPPATADGTDTSPIHYVAKASAGPSSLRRLLPFAAVAIVSLSAAGYYLMDRQANAQPAPAPGKPLLFTVTEAPPVAPTAATASRQAADAAPGAESASERALRLRYERELADLRRELAESRSRAAGERPVAAPDPEAREALAAGAANARPPLGGAAAATPYAARSVAAEEALTQPSAAEAATAAPVPEPQRAVAATPEPVAPEPRSPEPRTPEPRTPEARTPEPIVPESAIPEPAAPQQVAPPSAAAGAADGGGETPPRLIQRPQPRYPEAARRRGIGASVTIRVLVGANGRVTEVERVGPKAGLGFDRAAEDAARRSTWEPGSRGGEPAEIWTELRFRFQP